MCSGRARAEAEPGKALLKTYVAYGLTGIVLANVLSYVWINVFGVSKYVAPLINLVISIPLNFIINKFWAFRTPAMGPEPNGRTFEKQP